jgi:hypothetical protein
MHELGINGYQNKNISRIIKLTNQMSKKFSLNSQDLEKILKGACIALGGALLTYSASVIGEVDFGPYTPVIVAVGSILINAGLKFLEGK